MTTATIIVVEIFAKPVFAIVGILAGAFAAAVSLMRVIDTAAKLRRTHLEPRTPVDEEAVSSRRVLSNNARMMAGLNVKPQRTDEKFDDIPMTEITPPPVAAAPAQPEALLPSIINVMDTDRDDSSEIVFRIN